MLRKKKILLSIAAAAILTGLGIAAIFYSVPRYIIHPAGGDAVDYQHQQPSAERPPNVIPNTAATIPTSASVIPQHVKEATLAMRIDDVDHSAKRVEEIAAQLGGTFLKRFIGGDDHQRNAAITVRVPKENAREMVRQIRLIGHVVYETITFDPRDDANLATTNASELNRRIEDLTKTLESTENPQQRRAIAAAITAAQDDAANLLNPAGENYTVFDIILTLPQPFIALHSTSLSLETPNLVRSQRELEMFLLQRGAEFTATQPRTGDGLHHLIITKASVRAVDLPDLRRFASQLGDTDKIMWPNVPPGTSDHITVDAHITNFSLIKHRFQIDVFTNDIYKAAAQFHNVIQKSNGSIPDYSRVSRRTRDTIFFTAHVPHGAQQQVLSSLAQIGKVTINRHATDQSTPTYPDHLSYFQVNIIDQHFNLNIPIWLTLLIWAIVLTAAIVFIIRKQRARRRGNTPQTSAE